MGALDGQPSGVQLMDWGNLIGPVLGGAIIGQVCFVYGKRVGRRLERDTIVAHIAFWSRHCGRTTEEIIAAVKRRGQ